MKTIILRELFWLVLSFVLSLVLSFFFLELLDLTSSARDLKRVEQIFSVQLYLIGCVVSFISIYIVRIIVTAIKLLVQK
ncbi:hypothetical protein N9N76_01500 [Flavobacteriaceae bacterium]|nr:hypothetical protein [Flavobacteriaceae bacterium]